MSSVSFHHIKCFKFFFQEIIENCKEKRQNLVNKHKVFVLCLLSHGDDGVVYGSDGEKVEIEKIIAEFDGKRCEALIDRPKLFFIQACQGG